MTLEELGLNLKIVSTDELKPHPKNYNQHPDTQVSTLSKSLSSAWGQYKNIVTWNGYVLCGHGLLEAAKQTGKTHLAVNDCSHLTEQEALSLLISDNAKPYGSEPDTTQLDALLHELEGVDIPGADEAWLHSMQIQTASDVNIDAFFGQNIAPERQKHKDKITCPECGHEFEA